ncbi:hypothetical protein HGA92_05075 [Candidatus Gracilibacteria bacterium]|nr:hypothetical protein [Candidatus Gracilibacteria bacterium]NUJ98395.1 hypothetical protein [Candidatus Gracilibacteria bacterium]
MNFNKLSKYFSGKLPNSEKMNISEFVKVLGNLDIEGDFISEYGTKFGSVKTDYDNLFQAIYNSDDGKNKIYRILKTFELSKSFLETIDYSKEVIFENEEKTTSKELFDIELVEKFLVKATEDEFARYLMIPLMEEMGFKQLSFYGKVTEKDYGLDMYPVLFETPFGDHQILGIQFKKTNIGHGSTNTEWKNLKSELEDAFDHNGEHTSLNGSKIKIDGIITITSGKKTSLKLDSDLNEKFKGNYVRIYDIEDIIKWCQKFQLPINLKSTLESIYKR